ncbi:MAG: S9 family peptidase, partial [Acidobacteriota bacterium]|nr:S9 family peptidase [Acidobacteriota bacterium]
MRTAQRHLLAVSILFGISGAWAPAAEAQRRSITEHDLMKFVWVADPQISPDGSQVAFVRVDVNEKTDSYDTSIWIVHTNGTDGPRRLTGSTRDTGPRWSPDGRHLAFVRAPEKDGKVLPPQLHVLTMAGGEARAITDIPRGAGNPVWSPDGRMVAFSSTAKPSDLAAKPEGEARDPKSLPRQSDVRVITEPVYRANGVAGFGYVDRDRPAQVWTVSLPAPGAELPKPTPVVTGEFVAGNPSWSADGSQIYFVSDRRREPYYLPGDSDLYAVSKDGGDPRVIASIDGGIGGYAVAPDGKRIAFFGTLSGNPDRSYSQTDLWVTDAPGGKPRNLTEGYDFDAGGSLGGDQRAPRGAHPAAPVWTADGRSIIMRAGIQGDADLVRVDVGAAKVIDPVSKKKQDVMSYTATSSAARFAMVVSTATQVGDLFVTEGLGAPRKLTSFNEPLFSGLTLTEPE